MSVGSSPQTPSPLPNHLISKLYGTSQNGSDLGSVARVELWSRRDEISDNETNRSNSWWDNVRGWRYEPRDRPIMISSTNSVYNEKKTSKKQATTRTATYISSGEMAIVLGTFTYSRWKLLGLLYHFLLFKNAEQESFSLVSMNARQYSSSWSWIQVSMPVTEIWRDRRRQLRR